GRWVNSGLACTETKANGDQQQQCAMHFRGNSSSERRKDAPPDDTTGKTPSRAKTYSQPSSRDLCKCVAYEKCAKDPAKANISQTKLATDLSSRNRDVCSVQIG